MATAWINGQFVDEDDANVSLRDTGLLHAAGVFTTMRASGGRVFRLDRHLARLRRSCEALFVPIKCGDAELAGAVDELLERNDLTDARLRLTITRGQTSQDPLHGTHLAPNCFLTATELQPYPTNYYEQGLTVMLNDEQKLNPYDHQAGHKTLDYFSRLAGLREAVRRGAGEALWFNVHNYLQSASVANVFLVKDGALITPPTQEELRNADVAERTPYSRSNVLPGITRAAVIELAHANNLPVHIQAVNVNDLLAAREVFLTNSIMQVMPVSRIEQHPVGEGGIGPVTRALIDLYRKAEG